MPEDTARRYVVVIQDERGYSPVGRDPAPPDGPVPVTLHTVVKAEDYEGALRDQEDRCGLCGGFGAANAATWEPVPCMACGKASEGLILMALPDYPDPPDDHEPPPDLDGGRQQRAGLRLAPALPPEGR